MKLYFALKYKEILYMLIMKLWKKVIIFVLLGFLPTPNVKITIEFDIDDDGITDFELHWERGDFAQLKPD